MTRETTPAGLVEFADRLLGLAYRQPDGEIVMDDPVDPVFAPMHIAAAQAAATMALALAVDRLGPPPGRDDPAHD